MRTKSTIMPSQMTSAGFTLIETVLYMAILAIVASTLLSFLWNIRDSSIKNTTETEVSSSARYLSERLRFEIRNASGITSVSPTRISLATSTPATNPTVISLNGTSLQLTQGTNPPVSLHSSTTAISQLTFTNYSSSDSKTKHIGYTFTLSANFSGIGNKYTKSITIRSSAEVRSN